MVKKSHTITIESIDGIPYVRITGKLSDIQENDLNWDLFVEIYRIKGVRHILVDISDLHGRPGIVPTYYHVRECHYYDLFNKIAIVDRIDNKDYYSFHENTANNAGHNVRYFNEINEAISWLKSKTINSSGDTFSAFPIREGTLVSNGNRLIPSY